MPVYLVGAGPGDPGLLTVRGRDLLASADVVLYDALVDPRLPSLAGEGTILVDVGKTDGGPGLSGANGRRPAVVGAALHGAADPATSATSAAGKPTEAHVSSLHATTQERINTLLVAYGRRYETVVRLKGGDPFVFGRGGEEAAALAAAGVPFEVVPGVSSAIAAPAYAGIPITYRGLGASVAIVTGHEAVD